MLGRLNKRPRTLFVIDGLGALLSAFCLGFLLVKFELLIGMPKNILYILASFPILFALFDVYSYFQQSSRWKILLKIIAFANILYAFISLGMLIQHATQLTAWGYMYFIGEIIILVVLILVELRIANNLGEVRA